MRKHRILALLLCLSLSPVPVGAEAQSAEAPLQSVSSFSLQSTMNAEPGPISMSDGRALPAVYALGEPLTLSLTDGSEAAYWRYEFPQTGESVTYAVSEAYDGAAANDAATAAARALKSWSFGGAPVEMHIAALNRNSRVIHETTLQVSMAEPRILQQNCLPLPASITYGDALTVCATDVGAVASWRYDLLDAQGASIATTTSTGGDVRKALSGAMKSALHWGDIDLSAGTLTLNITALDASGAPVGKAGQITIGFENTAILRDDGSAVPASLTLDAFTDDVPSLTLRTVSGGEADWTLRAYNKKGELIGEAMTTAQSATKALTLSDFTMTGKNGARHIHHIEVTAAENGETSEPVSILVGTYCPACGDAVPSEKAHYVKNCGHYRCDGHNHYQANCHEDGHCSAYYVKHTRRCSACRDMLCDADGYNPANCYECPNCGEMMCVSGHLDHTVCEGCGGCLWNLRHGEHTQCASCGLYHCTAEGRKANHASLPCGTHTHCNALGRPHYEARCGKDGHYMCEGEHDACSGCKMYACDEGFSAIDHERCPDCGLRKCDPRYIESAHQLCAHCGGPLCEPGTRHTMHQCGVEGHYRCDGRYHNPDLISMYCEAEHQHRKCEGDPQHYCDPNNGGCGKTYSCKWSNVHTWCMMCGLRWCDRSTGGHQTPCNNPNHRPCQLPGFRYSDHAICEHCGNPKCAGSHAHCGEPFICPLCKKEYIHPMDHRHQCMHYLCVEGDHAKCSCGKFKCDGGDHSSCSASSADAAQADANGASSVAGETPAI